MRKEKIIAREFLLLITCAATFLLAFFGTFPYNYFIKNQINNLEIISQSLSDSVRKTQVNFGSKINEQERFFKISKKNGWHINHRNSKELWSKLTKLIDTDSIKIKWDNEWGSEFKKELDNEMGFKKASDFENYIKNNALTLTEEEENRRTESFIEEINAAEFKIEAKKRKLLNDEERLRFSFLILFVTILLIFPLRYLLYGIKWSINILKKEG